MASSGHTDRRHALAREQKLPTHGRFGSFLAVAGAARRHSAGMQVQRTRTPGPATQQHLPRSLTNVQE